MPDEDGVVLPASKLRLVKVWLCAVVDARAIRSKRGASFMVDSFVANRALSACILVESGTLRQSADYGRQTGRQAERPIRLALVAARTTTVPAKKSWMARRFELNSIVKNSLQNQRPIAGSTAS